MPFLITPEKMKYLDVYLTKHVLCAENSKMLLEEIKRDSKKWRNTLFIGWKTEHSEDISSLQIDL